MGKKKVSKTKVKKKGFRLQARLLLTVLVPTFLLAGCVSAYAVYSLRLGVSKSIEQGLKGELKTFQQALNYTAPGKYEVSAGGYLEKGTYRFGSMLILDDIKKDTDTDFTIFVGDTSQATSIKDTSTGKRFIGTKASEEVIQQVLKDGNDYYDESIDIAGTNYYGYYVPIENSDGTMFGMLFAGVPHSAYSSLINQQQVMILIVAAIFTLLVCVINILISRRIAKATQGAQQVVETVSKGDLTLTVAKSKRTDEIGDVQRSIADLLDVLKNVIGNVKETATALKQSGDELERMAVQSSMTSDDMSRAIEGISEGAVTQANDTGTATTSVIEIGDKIKDIVEKVDRLDESSEVMFQEDQKSDEILRELTTSNDQTMVAMDEISHHVNVTNDSVQSINDAITMISTIADQTNLLSLNASIEAARAGEQGKGFAVVASEIQKLAEQSNKSALQIQEIITKVVEASDATVSTMDNARNVLSMQQEKLNDTKNCLANVSQGIQSSKVEITGIRNQIKELDAAKNNIVDIVQNLSAISEENAASTEETTASMQELNGTLNVASSAAVELKTLANSLEDAMNYFQVQLDDATEEQ